MYEIQRHFGNFTDSKGKARSGPYYTVNNKYAGSNAKEVYAVVREAHRKALSGFMCPTTKNVAEACQAVAEHAASATLKLGAGRYLLETVGRSY